MNAKRFAGIVTAVLVLSAGTTINWMVGVPASVVPSFIRFKPPVVGAIVHVMAPVAVIALVPFILVYGTKRVRIVVGSLMTLLALLMLPVLLVASFDLLDVASQGYSNALEPVDSLEADGARWIVYRTNGGATTSFGILLRRERKMLPGLVVARNVRNWYPADEGDIERLDSVHVTVHVNGQEHVVATRE